MSEGRFRVELAPAAQRQLRRLPPGSAAALRGPILALRLDPRPPGATKLASTDFWRIRVGDLRVIYAIDEPAGLVVVLRVARRSESTYRGVGYGTFRTQDRVVDAAVERLYLHLQAKAEEAQWTAATDDPEFRAEVAAIAKAFGDQDRWPA